VKKILGFLFASTLLSNAIATQFSLIKLDSHTYEISTVKIREAIASDVTSREFSVFDKDQSFLLKGLDQQKLGYLIPLKFNSKSYKNTICRLYFLDLHNKFSYAELFAEKNDDDDVVSSCVGVEAAAIFKKTTDEAQYLAVIRYRTVNSYGTRGVVVNYKNGALLYDKRINSCIATDGETNNIVALKKKLLACM
jgi:hypothetical protein